MDINILKRKLESEIKMSDKQEIRPLTREEQLIWEISFLENSIKQQKEELKDCKKELIKIKKYNYKI